MNFKAVIAFCLAISVQAGHGKLLFHSVERLNWYEANEFCELWDASLVQIFSPEDHQAALEFYKQFHPEVGDMCLWIGLTDLAEEGQWIWNSEQAANETYWSNGEPNSDGEEDCAAYWYHGDKYYWNDVDCLNHRNHNCHAFCERFA